MLQTHAGKKKKKKQHKEAPLQTVSFWKWGNRVQLTVRRVRGGGSADTEAVEVETVAGHILLWLEHDDVDLGGKHAAQHHEATEADRDAHGGGLNLRRNQLSDTL